jgi:L-alanine-DL-glutamate epimerase-like enolase superfamily enzyme
MSLLQWSIRAETLPLRYTWKISRNASTEKTNLFVRVTDGRFIGTGEAAPNIRYGETPEALLEQFNRFANDASGTVEDVKDLYTRFEKHGLAYALRFAVESAWLHWSVRDDRKALFQRLGTRYRDHVPLSYTVPIMDPGEIRNFYDEQQLRRFPLIKLKIDRDRAQDLTQQLLACCHQPLILDANEAFTDVEDCIRFLEQSKRLPLEIVEQPLPSSMKEEAEYLKRHCPFPLFADEAITHDPDFDHLSRAYHGINMKLMKAGGYLAGAEMLQEAKKRGMGTMIGCMVETTLGISSALHLSSLADYADLDSFLLLKDEPFGLLKEKEGSISYSDPDRIGP